MGCKTPVLAFRDCRGPDPATGNWPLESSPGNGYVDLRVRRPCGSCIYCRLDYSRQKTVRLTHELQSWDCASFLTLTYDDDHLPIGQNGIPTLNRGQSGDMTRFLKRLRKALPKSLPIKYFQCAEYGDRTHRPHHHAIVYGYDFRDDRVPAGDGTYQSDFLDSVWQLGGCRIGNVTWDSASYVASYCVKKLRGDDAVMYDECGIEPPYATSSLGIGRQWIEQWFNDVYPRDYIVVKGHKQKPPRYYDDYLKSVDPMMYRRVMLNRQSEAEDNFDYDTWLNSYSANHIKSKNLEFWKNPKI